MVIDRLTDGKRIAQILSSEITGDKKALQTLSVTDATPDIEPTADGALAYRATLDADTTDTAIHVADVFVQADRVRVEFRVVPDVAAAAGARANLRVRPKAVSPPRTIVFVEDGAQVKWCMPVFEAVVDAVSAEDVE
ncbi:hypothetical protein HUB97_01070 [Halorubraceae archaeon YAN]|nr:hypothetical protein [Halorubraceae archaeon YAN]